MIRLLSRIPGFRRLWLKFPIGSVALRTEHDIWDRKAYAYGVYSSAKLAKTLGLDKISVIEFGVAGGNGLLQLEEIARQVSDELGINIQVYGFDTGTGMPPPVDYRDLPYVWEEGFYRMEPEKLRARLRKAELVLGNLQDTLPQFLNRTDLAPIAFVSFDLDYYSSTKTAFGVFDGPCETRLPRVYCYFDDVVWPEHACHNDFTGELCAIREYNEEQDRRKVAKLANLTWMRPHPARWNEQIYVHHEFDHPSYSRMITPQGEKFRQNRIV